jgi:hypothetical protein
MVIAMGQPPFFSADWCAEARDVANGSGDLQLGMADASSFDLRFVFVCTDREGLGSYADFAAGVVTDWITGAPTDDAPVVATLRGQLASWRAAAEGGQASVLLLKNRFKLKDTKRSLIANNYNAFDALLSSWADIDTEWSV